MLLRLLIVMIALALTGEVAQAHEPADGASVELLEDAEPDPRAVIVVTWADAPRAILRLAGAGDSLPAPAPRTSPPVPPPER